MTEEQKYRTKLKILADLMKKYSLTYVYITPLHRAVDITYKDIENWIDSGFSYIGMVPVRMKMANAIYKKYKETYNI